MNFQFLSSPLNSPDLSTGTFISKWYFGSESTRQSAGCGWFEAESDWCMSWSGTERYWQRHWSVAQTSPCLHSSHRRTYLIFIVT